MAFRQKNERGVGIVNFFEHKTIFVTGATGFMGKVFVEKILRVVPTVKKIYLLVRAHDAETAMHRLKTQIIDSKLFKVIREKHGQSYEEFMWNKLVPISGDFGKPCLGMDTNFASLVRNEVNVIVHIGANTKWNDRHDVALELNVKSLLRFVDFAKDCMNLVLFLYVSSAFATQEIPGVTFEKPIDLGQYITEDGEALGLSIEQLIDIEMRIISEVALRIQEEEDQEKEMIKLGMRRAKYYKMANNYLLTKSMGEMVVTKLMGKLPVVILRPTLIESTFEEPFPGWIEGYKALDPIILSYGTGQLEGFRANPNATMDVVPVDMVTNAMMTAMAKHGNEKKHGVYFYNVASTVVNPLTIHDIFNFCTNYFTSHPLKDSNGVKIIVKDMKFFESIPEFIIAGSGAVTASYAKLQYKFTRMAALYEPFFSIPGAWFDDKNTRNLLGEMSLEELNMFNFDFKCIDWKDYFTNIHIPGVYHHVFNKKKTLSSSRL
ncbi:fatty acyl-CoA reductase 2, chloroplastic-like [Silene latifolia]|uniref:fatty acyl-CoA reductase 2, chloroplastic-like n=1 Tax=Silene latifolia TaxID=37657 RepID=UPI003D77FA01